ncbi:metallophosphoesterase [Muricauda sp. SCSIO 64092]|uniref:metallophosphoesterase n=1 Tax=Allomuricauda sp. SCSIO 64092 TaxID=2908842 RepID=UPI001FF3298B|nr:metallophosphoesterase [Muricauda sp. SCSIO 64092]UOY04820.1 metallophosphoesterase [Muricauda sp. SCSIO 64092]
MKHLYLTLAFILIISGCATYKPKYADIKAEKLSLDQDDPIHTFYLIGDAGKSPMGSLNPALKAFQSEVSSAPKNSTAIFLGDNIYPAGLPDKQNGEAYEIAKNHLDAQLKSVNDFNGQTIFIPGNHDWYAKGLKGLKRQEKYIEDRLKGKDVFLPENGCPLDKVDIGDDIVLITIDTQWYLVDWDKHPNINDGCEIKDREKFLEELEGLIKKNRGKTTILAMHHPMFTYGSHGGQFSFKQHIFPTEGSFPLPIIGTLANVLRRTTGASNTDLSNKTYNELKKRIVTLAQYSEKVIFVSGHEHTLQYIVEENTPQIVSGSGAKKGATRLLNGSQFSTGQMGYAVLKVYADGASTVTFKGVEDEVKSTLFEAQVLPPNQQPAEFKGESSFPAYVKASIYTDEEVDKTGFYKMVWGERYRKYYATKVKAPTVDLDTLYGGLVPIRKGGGHQSKSLRLQHKDGRQFVMRALRKSAELYLQALAFQEKYVVGEFEDTFTESILLDFYTGSHPYAPFAVGTLSDAVGIFHTNPKLFYIPKQKALKGFNVDFGDELYMIEEHVSEGHDLDSFGKTEKIESTDDFIGKLRKDEEYLVDANTYVRARLFDMLIGDWDRHVDQWRWARFKKEDGTKVFKPIPRDRDQAFSIMGDGALMAFASRAVPSLRLFEGFQEEIRSVKGFNSSPMTFALDMALLSETTLEDWMEQAKYIQQHIDAKTVDKAFQQFPEEVRDETVDNMKTILLKRKESLVKTAESYYGVLNKYSVITGTDKDDHFVINPLDNGRVDVKAYRIKGGKKTDLFFDKVFDPDQNKEIWVYGLDDDDIFEVNGNTGQIKVRLIGGQNNDVYKINEKAKNVHVYDFKAKKNSYEEAFAGKIHKINDYDTNTYQFIKIKSSNNQFLPSIGFNPDDGLRVGATNTYTFNGFRQNPFTQQHTLNAAYYFATNGFDFGYRGEFANVFEKVNLELEAKFTSPNFAINFFGFGNDTPNFDDDVDFDFNRVKIRQLHFSPSLVWRGFLGSKVKLGVSYENFDVEETEGRFIEGFFTNLGRDTQQEFFGVNASYSYSNFDNEAFPTMGMAFSLEGGYTTNLNDADRTFGYVIPSLSFDYRLVPSGQLVLATKFKGHFNIGDDFEFYQAASIGANNGLRGFRFQRFTGKTAYFQNTDVRWSFRERRTGLLPVTPGIYGGFDYGRVWIPNEDSDTWHNSYGGGFFVNGADILSFNAGLFNSSDGLRFAFGLGFGF